MLGDSSLDNKAWVGGARSRQPRVKAVNGFEAVLDPPESVRDVAYFLNKRAARSGGRAACMNCAVEASTLASRRRFFGMKRSLWQHDEFAAAHTQRGDAWAVSIGGNDVALKPSLMTIISMLRLVHASTEYINGESTSWRPMCDIAMRHMVWLFGTAIQRYIEDILARCPVAPRRIAVCSIYFPLESSTGSWADFALEKLGYNTDPAKVQLLIKILHERAVSKIRLRGPDGPIPVVPVPLFEVLNPQSAADYVERVEPSIKGGSKIADRLWDDLLGSGDGQD